MDVKPALKNQYRAALAMFRETVELCPDELWNEGADERYYWRIAYHTVFYSHLYLLQSLDDFTPWEKHRGDVHMWHDLGTHEKYTKDEILEYLMKVENSLEELIDNLDLSAEDCGFPWYSPMPKLHHQFVNIRHIQQHAGQLCERLFAHGIETSWVGGSNYL